MKTLLDRVLSGEALTRVEVLRLIEEDLETLCSAANTIRKHFCGSSFELCTIINAKSGRCPEDCRFCAQSARNLTAIETYPLMNPDAIVAAAQKDAARGIIRFAPVTSGRRLSPQEVQSVAETLRRLKSNTPLELCASCGLLDMGDLKILKEAGLTRYHNNLEASSSFFPIICTTHTMADKIKTIRAAQQLGLEVCSGGIMGLGESWEDRVDMALTLHELGVQSIPINILNPIPGTPLGAQLPLSNDEVRRIFALFRFLNPKAFLRLAGGRSLLPDRGRACLQAGGNALISGDMLTTKGYSIETDLVMIHELGFKVTTRLLN